MQVKITSVPTMLVEITEAETKKTRDLLGEILAQLNADKRIKFYTSRGRGAPTVQCLRVMLSRIRNKLEQKNRRRKHFKLHADVIPWTLTNGERKDCVIVYRSRNRNHEALETLEDLLVNGTETLELA